MNNFEIVAAEMWPFISSPHFSMRNFVYMDFFAVKRNAKENRT